MCVQFKVLCDVHIALSNLTSSTIYTAVAKLWEHNVKLLGNDFHRVYHC